MQGCYYSNMIVGNLTPSNFFIKGMTYLNRLPSLTLENEKRFRANFGTTPSICFVLWEKIEALPSSVRYFHLLWALLFLKTYQSEKVISGIVGGVDEGTYRQKIWAVIGAISKLKQNVICFTNRFAHQNGSICLLSIDGTDCKVNEPSPFSKRWFSHKFKHAGLRYEIGLCIQTGWIVWIMGPFAAGDWPDLKIFRMYLKKYLCPNECVEADGGYQGDERVHAPLDFCYNNIAQYQAKLNVRARHETLNGRMKNFHVLSETFRHDLSKHECCFNAVAVITQLAIENGEPLYSVKYRTHNIVRGGLGV